MSTHDTTKRIGNMFGNEWTSSAAGLATSAAHRLQPANPMVFDSVDDLGNRARAVTA